MIRAFGIGAILLTGVGGAGFVVYLIGWLWLAALDQVVDAFGLTRAFRQFIWHRRDFLAWNRRRQGDFEVDEET